ncbi:aspartate/glutamate racemase family protein [Propioniciclava soli]|uniref:aspartate/glutamate racemase family protein n=1 Tax=Propioniciclava soli TaxID=2775081 RepID=UPI001E2F7665
MTPGGQRAGRIVGLIHTAPDNAVRFDALVRERLPDAEQLHVVDAWLLDEAVRHRVDGRHDERIAAHVEHLTERGAAAILVTCSSIGEVGDRVALDARVPVLRVDRPMARRAAALAKAGGGRITALATLASTLEPTTRLLTDEAGSGIEVAGRIVEGAIQARHVGDTATFDRLIGEAVDAALADGAVIVLAQATMANALGGDDRGGCVLSSPASAADALAEAADA